MKKLTIFRKTRLSVLLLMGVSLSCTNLDEDLYSEVTPDTFFKNQDQFVSALGAAYTSLYDYGNGDFRKLQENTTDEMVTPTRGQDWDDGGTLRRLHLHSWNLEDPSIGGGWSFCFGGVNSCNRLIYTFQTLVEEGNVEQADADAFIAELKVLRAFYYYQLIDLYGNVPIVTDFADANPTPSTAPRQEVFDFVRAELDENVPKLSKTVDISTYGRMNYYVGKMLQAKLYLNAEIFTGNPMWDESIAACDEIINAGAYTLEANYFTNFNVNNQVSKEFIWAIPYDEVFAKGFNLGVETLSYASQATYNFNYQPWNGFCSLQEFYNSHDDQDVRKGEEGTVDGPTQVRGNFVAGYQYTSGGEKLLDPGADADDPDGPWINYSPYINELGPQSWRQVGARIGKWEFENGGNVDMNNDFAIYRYAETLLIKAEALWRKSGNPADALALSLVNQIRSRAGVDDLTTLDGPVSFDAEGPMVAGGALYNEIGREMFAENIKRPVLIRFGLFTQVSKWALPDKIAGEVPLEAEYTKLFPVPRGQLNANPNLKQNPGYSGGSGG